ncbi:hypothetical protein FLAN108750_10905 [Flavobacterium antarcticum]|uniref:hypothetical protein n=1 Tax=Flavobacterium antarcticum TaxID=271155 RepID=UPI0003B3BAA8|nr:hypothetical protein [Flavobacterium antarcticum]
MIKTLLFSIFFTVVFSSNGFTQENTKELQFGIPFSITVPSYMNRTTGLNGDAAIHFKNAVKDVYGIIIEDNKEELELSEYYYSSLKEFTESFRSDFLTDEPTKKFSTFTLKTIGDLNFSEFDASYTSAEDGTEIYYWVGLVESKKAFYKILLWTTANKKDVYKEEFRKIFYSFKA